VVVHPFSFRESLDHLGNVALAAPGPLDPVRRSHLERAFLDWLSVGGFPEAQRLDVEVRHRLLRDYVDVVMMRDVVERHEVRNVLVLRRLVRHLLGNPGGLFSVEKFHGALKSQGVAAGREQVGRALETAVLVELERRGRTVHYVRTREGHEVDFLARSATGMELIQVCADATDGGSAARELRALVEARREYPGAAARFLVGTKSGLPEQVPEGVEVATACEWMLGEG
jgi:hypothetical protein